MKGIFAVIFILLETILSQTLTCGNLIKVNSTDSELNSLLSKNFDLIKEDP